MDRFRNFDRYGKSDERRRMEMQRQFAQQQMARRQMPPPPVGGIASAFQGVNPVRAGYDVGNAAQLAQQARAQSGLQQGQAVQLGDQYSRYGLDQSTLAARQAFDQQARQSMDGFQQQLMNAAPEQRDALQRGFSQQLQAAENAFNQQNPQFMQKVNAYQQANMPQIYGLQPQGQMGQPPLQMANLASQLGRQQDPQEAAYFQYMESGLSPLRSQLQNAKTVEEQNQLGAQFRAQQEALSAQYLQQNPAYAQQVAKQKAEFVAQGGVSEDPAEIAQQMARRTAMERMGQLNGMAQPQIGQPLQTQAMLANQQAALRGGPYVSAPMAGGLNAQLQMQAQLANQQMMQQYPQLAQQYGMQQGQMGQLGGMGQQALTQQMVRPMGQPQPGSAAMEYGMQAGPPMQYQLGMPQGLMGGMGGALQPAGGLQSGLTGLGGQQSGLMGMAQPQGLMGAFGQPQQGMGFGMQGGQTANAFGQAANTFGQQQGTGMGNMFGKFGGF